MSPSSPLPIETLCHIIDFLIFDHDHRHNSNSNTSSDDKISLLQETNNFKAPWGAVEGVTRTSRLLREVALRSWYTTISIHQVHDWSYLAKRDLLCSRVREAHVMRFNAFVDLFHLFPILKRVHLRFMSFSEHICGKLHWIPNSIVELELALPNVCDSFILATLAQRFTRLTSLKLMHSRAWTTPKSLEAVTEDLSCSDLALLPGLKFLSLGVLSAESPMSTFPQDVSREGACSLRLAESLEKLEAVEWTQWTPSVHKPSAGSKILIARDSKNHPRILRIEAAAI